MNNNQTMQEKKVIDEVIRIIESESHVTKIEHDGNNIFEYDIYVDYSDHLSDDQVSRICESEDKWATFYELLDEFSMECISNEEVYLLNLIELHWREEEFGDYNDSEDIIREWIFDNISFNFPYDHYLNTEINLNIIVDNGDANYDYTLNNFLSYNASEEEWKDEEVQENSSIMWLVEQQGYTKEQFFDAIENGTEDTFLKSVIEECVNVITHMNALAFFVKMTIGDYIKLIDDKERKYLKLSSDVNCGLYDCWGGAGSILNIALKRDVTLPIEKINSITLDGHRGYGINEIYGMCDDFWTESIEIN